MRSLLPNILSAAVGQNDAPPLLSDENVISSPTDTDTLTLIDNIPPAAMRLVPPFFLIEWP
jgi:hypothetical protein